MNLTEKISIVISAIGFGWVLSLMILISLSDSHFKYVSSERYQEEINDRLYKNYVKTVKDGDTGRERFNNIIKFKQDK
jgi:hypothetical protein